MKKYISHEGIVRAVDSSAEGGTRSGFIARCTEEMRLLPLSSSGGRKLCSRGGRGRFEMGRILYARAYINNIRQYRIKIRIFLASNNGGATVVPQQRRVAAAATAEVVVAGGV